MDTHRRPGTTRLQPLGEALMKLARRYAAQETRDLRELVMGPTQRSLLELVVDGPGLSMTVAAEHLGVDKAAVTRAARRLERNGFVERRGRDGGGDRRVRELHPTAAGRAVRWVADPGDVSPDARLLAGFGAEDRQRLHEYFARMDANLDVPVEDYVRRLAVGSRRFQATLD